MTDQTPPANSEGGAFTPLRHPAFRNIWFASLLSNFGYLIFGIGATWEMTRLTNTPTMIAGVQTALMLPLVAIAVPAGAFADMFDRRKLAMAGLAVTILLSAVLAVLIQMGLSSPWLIYLFCALIGSGFAMFSPAWQSSVREQVLPAELPAAIALSSISYNVARTIGPAIGGAVVVALGAQAAFDINAFSYIPLFLAFLFWKRPQIASRLPPERIDRAIFAGARYARLSMPIRRTLLRSFLFGLGSSSSVALGALIAKDLLHGDAGTYGILLGAGGVGAVIGALLITRIRELLGTENGVRICMAISAVAMAVVGVNATLWITLVAFAFLGGANIVGVALMNVSVQFSSPRWVMARTLSLFTSSLTFGVAIGAMLWGWIANEHGLEFALVASSFALLAIIAVGFVARLPDSDHEASQMLDHLLKEPDVDLDLTLRSGPIVIEIDYDVDPGQARDFYRLMLRVQRMRERNGAFGWSLSRVINNAGAWVERFEFPTWGDYLRMRDRTTAADQALHNETETFHRGEQKPCIRRHLERPFGSVRWRAETPDTGEADIKIYQP